ncbi:hypothetical protein OG210_29815 [Streptomyces sp. NBC_00466]
MYVVVGVGLAGPCPGKGLRGSGAEAEAREAGRGMRVPAGAALRRSAAYAADRDERPEETPSA